MAFVVEDGTGLPTANSFVTVGEGDDYYSLHLYNSLWTVASTEKKQSALVMSSKRINASFIFKGNQISTAQALKWPRYGAQLPYDANAEPLYNPTAENMTDFYGATIPSNVVPQQVKDATMEFARFLLSGDRDTDQDKSVVKRQKVAEIEREFFQNTAPGVVPQLIGDMLADVILGEASRTGGGTAVNMSRG